MRWKKIKQVFGIWYGLKYYMAYSLHKRCYIEWIGKRIIKLRYKKHNLYVRLFSRDLDFLESIYIGQYHNGKYSGEYEVKGADECEAYIDLGANIGLFTVLYALRYPNKTIVSVEPEKTNYALLKRNTVELKNVICLNNAVWYKNAWVKVYESSVKIYPSNTPSEGGFYVGECKKTEEDAMFAVSINSIVDKFNIDNYMVKMDVEGAEYAIFEKGKLDWIEKCKMIVMETHDRLFSEYSEQSIFKIIKTTHYRKRKVGENHVFIRR